MEEEKQVVAEQTEKKEEPSFSPKDALNEIAGAPSKEQIDKWKAMFGHIFITAFSESEVYIYRSIDRATWRQLNEQVTETQRKMMETADKMRSNGATDDQIEVTLRGMDIDQEELTVRAALLWPEFSPEMTKKAGIITSLANMIMENSRFVPPQVAAALTEEL